MLKRLLTVFLCLVLGLSIWLGTASPVLAKGLFRGAGTASNPATERLQNPIDENLGKIGAKVDLNNSNVMAFRRYPGLYPTLARKIIQHAPFESVEEVLNIPGLSESEQAVLKANLKNFVVTPAESALTEGGDRINPGIYK
ncbi:photosystem II complex extrinsic protein PsbU [Leptolyngbya sp. KIOST-1]|uniref:photosystem II complex extrinsic protein PsbU n=1 Tax=Leptolyngbya sp. KIOST-1 TaxID=1229172 RepID=UPI00056D4D46|nr:photosystem II complex extrinsic protein PsbU [Leptolyngbya sp. KIOST-1]